jgi:hypothetical protein
MQLLRKQQETRLPSLLPGTLWLQVWGAIEHLQTKLFNPVELQLLHL